jgi:hypothetical protein
MSDFLNDIIPTESVPAAIDAARSIVIVKDFKIGGSAISSWLSPRTARHSGSTTRTAAKLSPA